MKKPRFFSLRWRLLLPLAALILVIVTTGAYLMALQSASVTDSSAVHILEQSRRGIEQQAATLFDNQWRAAQAVATISVMPQVLREGEADNLTNTLAARARRANLDDLLLTNASGKVVLGLRRVADSMDYAVMETASLRNEPLFKAVRAEDPAVDFAQIDGEMMLYTAVPVERNAKLIGTVFVGQRLPWVLATLHTSVLADAVLFGPDQQWLASTLPADADVPPVSQTMESVEARTISGQSYQTLYFPFEHDGITLGAVGVLVPTNVTTMLAAGRQLTALLVAMLAAGVLIAVFAGISMMTARIGRITRVAEALTRGERTARTNMQPADEIGRMGYALDRYADYAQERQDALRTGLRRQRRETERLTAVLEAMPDGVIVQDIDGRVLLMNEPARTMLGSRRLLRTNPDLHELTAFVTDRLGPALAPGIYALGTSQRIRLDGRTISAQAAAVMTITQQRIGTLIMLRDVSAEVQAEAARDKILQQLADEVEEPLVDLSRMTRTATPAQFSQEIRPHVGALQKLIVEMRELTDAHLRKAAEEQQRPLLLDTLVWAVANEWRQVAQAQNLKLHVQIEKPGQYVLGEERRLRWAIGNIIDNAIKYTPPGGDLTLEVRDDDSDERAHLRVRDNGVGIARDELPHVFTRFYRGKPVTREGREIRVPGSGQGLTVARQIFEAHGGTLAIKSRKDVGTAAYFTIPLTSPVSLELPQMAQNLEEETVRIDTRQIDSALSDREK